MGTADIKKRTNVSISGALLDKAHEMGLNISSITESALEQAVRRETARRWQEENAAAISERSDWIERIGLPLADIQVLRT